MIKNYNENFERGSNTKEYWSEKHRRQYKLDEPFDFSNIESEKRSYNYVGSKLIIENKESFKRKKLLEIGCGNGYFAAYIKSQLPDWYVEAWDFSPAAIQSAQKKAPDVVFKERDFILNPVEEDFGAICLFEVLEHTEEGINYKLIDQWLKHCEYLVISVPTTTDSCFGEHISHYKQNSFRDHGYNEIWNERLTTIDMSNVGDFGDYFYFITLIRGNLS